MRKILRNIARNKIGSNKINRAWRNYQIKKYGSKLAFLHFITGKGLVNSMQKRIKLYRENFKTTNIFKRHKRLGFIIK